MSSPVRENAPSTASLAPNGQQKVKQSATTRPNGQPKVKRSPTKAPISTSTPNGDANASSSLLKRKSAQQLALLASRRSKVRTRRSRISNLLENPENEVWLLRLPGAPQLTAKLNGLSFDLDTDTGEISGHLLKNYVFRNLNVSGNISVALRDERGDWKAPPRKIDKSIAVSFVPNTKPFHDSSNNSTNNPMEAEAQVIAPTTEMQPRFPVGGKSRTAVSDQLKESLETLMRKKINALPKVERTCAELYVEEKTEDEEDDAQVLLDTPMMDARVSVPGVRVNTPRKSKALNLDTPPTTKLSAVADRDNNNGDIEDPLSQPTSTANTPDGEKEKAASLDKIPSILNDNDNDNNNEAQVPLITDDTVTDNDNETLPPSQPSVLTQAPVDTDQGGAKERGEMEIEREVDDDGMGPNEGNTVDEKRTRKKKKKRKSTSMAPAEEVKEEENKVEEEGPKKKKKKKRKSKSMGMGIEENEVKEEEKGDMSKKEKKKKKKRRANIEAKDEELLVGEKEERTREKNREIMKQLGEEKDEETLEKENINHINRKKKKKNKNNNKRKISEVNGETAVRKSKKKKSHIAAE